MLLKIWFYLIYACTGLAICFNVSSGNHLPPTDIILDKGT